MWFSNGNKIDLQKLAEDISQIQNVLNRKVTYLNNGGCVHFAYYFSKRLEEIGIKHSIYFSHYGKIGRTLKTFVPVAHVVVYIKGIGYIDGHKTQYPYHDNLKKTKLSLEEVRWVPGWNNDYDHERYNPIVEETINKFINDHY